MKTIWAFSLLSFTVCHSSLVAAETAFTRTQQCQQALQRCYLDSNDKRSVCLDLTTRSKLCEQDSIAALVQERLTLTGVSDGVSDDSIGLDVVDHSCINNFDAMLSAELMKGIIGTDSRKNLTEQLSQCSQKASINLFRP